MELHLKRLILAALLTLSPHSFSRTVTISTGEWPPYHSENQNDAFVLNIIKEIYAENKIKVDYQFFPWARSYLLVKDGTVHASASWEPENDPKLYYSSPLFEAQYVFFHLKSNKFQWQGWTLKLL